MVITLILSNNVNELANVRFMMWENKIEYDSLSLCVCPTYMCNLKCRYCFENDWTNKKHVMSEDEFKVLESFMTKSIIDQDLKSFRITWSGGEPLLAYKQIANLNRNIGKICENNGTKFYSTLATNATLITKDVIEDLMTSGIYSVQITLDGSKEIHNRNRISPTYMETYDDILGNIKKLNECCPAVKILIRLHVSHTSIASIDRVIEDIECAGLKNRVTISYSRLKDQTDSLSIEEFANAEIDLYKDMLLRGWNISHYMKKKIRPRTNGCAAYSKASFSIGPDLSAYKCWELAYDDKHKFGEINPAGDLEKNGIENIAQVYDPFDLDKCLTCIQLPLCVGGCAKGIIEKGDICQKGSDDLVECSPIKYNMKDIVRLYISSLASQAAE